MVIFLCDSEDEWDAGIDRVRKKLNLGSRLLESDSDSDPDSDQVLQDSGAEEDEMTREWGQSNTGYYGGRTVFLSGPIGNIHYPIAYLSITVTRNGQHIPVGWYNKENQSFM